MDGKPTDKANQQRKQEIDALTETKHALKDSRHLLQMIIDTIEGEVFVKDSNGKYLFVNNAFGKDFGVDPNDVIGKDDFFVFMPEDAEVLKKNDRQIMAGKKAVNVEENGIIRGKQVTYLTNKAPLIDDDGNVFGICGVGVDITRQKKVEKALRESEAKYQDLYDSAPDMFVSVDTKNANIIDCNHTLANALGYTKEEIIGRPVFDIYAPDSAEYAKKTMFSVFVKTGKIEDEELQLQRKDGSKMDVSLNASAVRDEHGRILSSRSVWRDITRRKGIEEELKKAHHDLERKVRERTAELSETVEKLRDAEWRYRTVADFTYDWEDWENQDGTFQYVSPACERISGYAPRQFMDNPSLFREIIIPEDQDVWDKHCQDCRREPEAREMQFRIRSRDGAIRWIEHACRPVQLDQGEVLGFRASNRDITDRKQIEIELSSALSEVTGLKNQLEAESSYFKEEIKLAHNYETIIGESDVLKYVLYRVEQIAPTETTVLIQGETGTGKELFARAIHDAGPRKERPIIKVNCASLPANLIESELFGYEKSAFTGAAEKRVGRFELADGGTLFLDEIGELPLELQPKLLRVLQDGEFERLGSSRTIRTDARIITATNRNLDEEVRKGRFRKDLWYRLNVFPLTAPPLRDRTTDIPMLVSWFVKKFERKLGKSIRAISTDTIARLQRYSWPGNVRELENVIERAVINTGQHGRLQLDGTLEDSLPRYSEAPDLPIKSLAEMEREYILMALKKTKWQIHGHEGAAALLDLNPSTLRGRMRKHGIQRPAYQA